MLNHTYTSVKNANLVDCGKKQHIPSQPSTLLRDNYLGEYRTELDKKKVLANLGIVTDVSLEWEYIKGDIGKSAALMQELDSRTKYISEIDGFQKTVIEGIKWLEGVIGGEQDVETEQDSRIENLENISADLILDLEELKEYLETTIEVDIDELQKDLNTITEKVANITNLIQVSSKAGNALKLIGEEELEEGETPGLYVPDLSDEVSSTTTNVVTLQTDVKNILDTYVTKEQLGGGGEGGFNFVDEGTYNSFVSTTNNSISDIRRELNKTVKTGEDGHVDTLYVNKISKNNDDGNIKITDSFEVESGIPLDVRFVVKSLEELHSLKPTVCYAGMGVIVSDQASLYILREPIDGIIDEAYIKDEEGVNWKCPEDLVTVALSRSEYENLENPSPHVFYYIYEDEFKLTHKPRPEEYDNEEDFNAALEEWTAQIKILDQQYLSASWGLEIEELLSKKASAESVNLLKKEINSIKGNGEGPSLDSLNTSLRALQEQTNTLETSIDDNSNKISKIKEEVENVTNSLDNYITKDDLQDESAEFIFVKTSDYNQDKEDFSEQLAKQINTELVTSTSINTKSIETDSLVLNDTEVAINDDRILVGNKSVAFSEELIKIKVLTQSDYDDLPETSIEEDVYYYTYEDETPMATKAELQKATEKISQLETKLMLLSQRIEQLENFSES